VSPDNAKEFLHQLQKFNLGPYTDCPVFDGLYEFRQLYTGGSIDGKRFKNPNNLVLKTLGIMNLVTNSLHEPDNTHRNTSIKVP
jgi:hypothetical protein